MGDVLALLFSLFVMGMFVVAGVGIAALSLILALSPFALLVAMLPKALEHAEQQRARRRQVWAEVAAELDLQQHGDGSRGCRRRQARGA